jgi:[ribosomal protein S18]-alanine N-acetyltransferase
MNLTVLPINEAYARQIINWRYPPPYHIYDLASSDPDDMETAVSYLITPHFQFHCLMDEHDQIVAFCSFGIDGQIPGGDYSVEAIDIGMGVRPDLTGKGLGIHFAQAVVDFASTSFAHSLLRVTIASFNLRAQRVWQKQGFVQTQTFRAKRNQQTFIILICPISILR